MNELSNQIKLNNTAKSMLSHLFYDKIVQLEAENKEGMSLSKQIEIKKLMDQVNIFIDKRPNSNFEVRVLEKGTDDKENFKLSLCIKTYKGKLDRPTLFIIVIDSAFSTVHFYEMALNNVLFEL